jgi:LemA protein
MLGLGIGAPVVALAIWGIILYNRFVRRRNQVLEAWSGIDVHLKWRHSLIPNLVDAVKAYAGYEERLLTRLTELRSAQQPKTVSERGAAESALSQTIRGLVAVAEAYPNLKASESFLELQRAIAEVEEQIQYARRYYNGTVRELNVLVESFPSNLIAQLFHFRPAEYFEIELATQREPPELKL